MGKKKIDPNALVCANCGSFEVQTKMWVDSNTHEVEDMVSDGESDDNWCKSCETHPRLITYDEYKANEDAKIEL